jgi:hypothetical protein
VHDVALDEAVRRGDGVDDRDRTFEREFFLDPDLLQELSPNRIHEALARVDAAARKQPVFVSRLLVPAEEQPVSPPKDGRHAESRSGP